MNEVKPQQPIKRHPQRSCVVCRSKDAKRQLTRLVKTETGIFIDMSGKMNGRGAYLCDATECWERAMTSDVLNKALRTTMTQADRLRIQQAMPTL